MTTEKIDNETLEFARELLSIVTLCKQWAASKIPKDGLSLPRMQILMYLRDIGSSPMRGLNKHLGTSATNVTGLVDGLEAEGLIVRSPDSKDRRVINISITKAGMRRVKAEWSKYEKNCASTFADLPASKRKQVMKSLNILREQIQN